MIVEITSNVIFSFIVATLILIAFIIFIITFALLFQKRQVKYLQEKALIKTQYEQEILKSQLEVQNQSLQYFGRELHDNIGQLLTVLKINIGTITYGIGSEQPADLTESIKELNEVVDLMISEVRGLSKSLDSNSVQQFGLQESLAFELQRIRKTKRFKAHLHIEGAPYRLDFQREIVLFRIAQEILNNALKHSQATLLTVTITYQSNNLQIIIKDDGKGFDLEKALHAEQIHISGMGLRSIHNRASLVGGACYFDSTLGNGTTVTITVPLY